ncbi:MAG: histidine phosphatase family protein [Thiobacillus sp.]
MHHIPKPVSTRICIIRHGETEWNAEKRIQVRGAAGLPLCTRSECAGAGVAGGPGTPQGRNVEGPPSDRSRGGCDGAKIGARAPPPTCPSPDLAPVRRG